MRVDTFGTRGTFDTGSGEAVIYRLSKLAAQNIGHIDRLPFSIKILLENALRNLDNFEVTEDAVRAIANWNAAAPQQIEIPFKPARVDFAGLHGRPGSRRSRRAAQRDGALRRRPAAKSTPASRSIW